MLSFIRLEQTGAGSSTKRPRSAVSPSIQSAEPESEIAGNTESEIVQEPSEDQRLEALLHRHRQVIEADDQMHNRQDIYNVRVNDSFTMDSFANTLRGIYQRQRSSFKINLSFSFVLRNIETGELRFFYASNNTNVLDKPMLVHNDITFSQFIDVLRTLDVLEWVRNQRPNSKWVFFKLVQTLVTVTRLNFPIGAPVDLPPYILSNPSIIALANNRHSGEPYIDNLCLFRCLALHQGEGECSLERVTKALFDQYLQETSMVREDFDGVDLSELCFVEECFEVAIHLYSIDETGQAISVRRSVKEFRPMYVNLYDDHCSYITSINGFSQAFVCWKCDKIFW